MRRIIILTGLAVVILFLAYRSWPIASASGLASAVDRGDVAAVAERVDLAALRASLARQIARAYLEQSGRGEELATAGRSAVIAAEMSLAEAYVADILTSETIETFLKEGRMGKSTAAEQPLPAFSNFMGTAFLRVFLTSYFDGLTRFVIIVDEQVASPNRYGVIFELYGLTWRVAELDLPRDLRNQLARELMDRDKKAADRSG